MATNSGINMQVDQVNALASSVNALGGVVQQMVTYAGDAGGLTAAHFGGVQGGADVGNAVLGTIAALSKSVGTAQSFLTQASQAMAASAKATKQTDEDAAWGVTNAGQGH